MKQSWNYWRRYSKRLPESNARMYSPVLTGRALCRFYQRVQASASSTHSALKSKHFPKLVIFRVNDMKACRPTGLQQWCIGTDDGQPQGLEFQRQRQVQDLW